MSLLYLHSWGSRTVFGPITLKFQHDFMKPLSQNFWVWELDDDLAELKLLGSPTPTPLLATLKIFISLCCF